MRATERSRGADPMTATTLKHLLATNTVVNAVVGKSGSVLALRVGTKNPLRKVAIATSSGNHMGKCIKGPSMYVPTGDGKGLSITNTINMKFVGIVGSVKLGRPCIKRITLRADRVTRSLACCFTADRRMPSTINLKILVGGSGAMHRTNKFVIRLVPFTRRDAVTGLRRGIRGVASIAGLLRRKRAPRDLLRGILRNFSVRVGRGIPARFCYGYDEREIRGTLVDVKEGRLGRVVRRNGSVRVGYRFYGGGCRFAIRRLGRVLHGYGWRVRVC